MRILIVIGFMIMGGFKTGVADSDIFPLQQLELGMSLSDLLKACPNVRTAFVKKDTADQLIEGLFFCEIENGLYWDAALIKVEEGKIQSWSYVRTRGFDRASRNVGTIHNALRRALGDTADKKVAFNLVKQGYLRSPVFIWQHGDGFVAFSHSPVSNHKSGEPFICQLTIYSSAEMLRSLFDLAADKKNNDSELFQEAMSENAKADN